MRWLRWWRHPALLCRVIVNFTHDPTEALEGVLWQARGPWLVLRDVEALKVGAQPAKMVGEVVIDRSKVAYLQVVP